MGKQRANVLEETNKPDLSNYLKIKDIRKIDASSGKPITDKYNMEGIANPEVVKNIITAAKKYKLDPNTMLAISMQETGFGMERPDNPFTISKKSNPNMTTGDMIENAMKVYKEKMQQAKKLGKNTDEEQIQAWNGYGKVGKDFYRTNSVNQNISKDNPQMKSFYGVDVTKEPLDMNTNPVYGKRIVDLRENIIKQHPEIQQMVKDVYGGEPIHATNEHIQEAMAKTGHTNVEDFTKWFNATKGKTIITIE